MFLCECCQSDKSKALTLSPLLIFDFIFIHHRVIIVAIKRAQKGICLW